jgi:hypothetical protein
LRSEEEEARTVELVPVVEAVAGVVLRFQTVVARRLLIAAGSVVSVEQIRRAAVERTTMVVRIAKTEPI